MPVAFVDRVRAYYDVHPSRDSALTLDPSRRNRWGDPLPAVRHVLDEPTTARKAATREHIVGVFDRLAKANGGRILNVSEGSYLDHPAGGCRMGTDAKASIWSGTKMQPMPTPWTRRGKARDQKSMLRVTFDIMYVASPFMSTPNDSTIR